MRWFRGSSEAPRLLSLSPLQADEDLDGGSFHFHAASQFRDMSPVRWTRRKSSSSESERNCYNVQTSQITSEKCVTKKDKKKIQEERRRICEKRNPLLDRVKSTRLSFFKDKDDSEEDEEEDGEEEEDEEEEAEGVEDEVDLEEDRESLSNEKLHFHSMYELRRRELSRRSICETDFKQLTEEERTQAKRKRRSKSQSRISCAKDESNEKVNGRGASRTLKNGMEKDEENARSKKVWRQNRSELDSRKLDDRLPKENSEEKSNSLENSFSQNRYDERSRFDSITPSSCLAAKFRAMQDRYLKNSTTGKLISKIYKKDASKEKEKRRLRSFSYGTLPGVEELRTNPLYEDNQDQDDNDSGILDNDSATSSLLDDRCSSGASGLSGSHCFESLSLPPQLPPKPSKLLFTGEEKSSYKEIESSGRSNFSKECSNPVCQAANNELIKKTKRLNLRDKRTEGLKVIKSDRYQMETLVVRLTKKEKSDECLGIFIAKNHDSSPGYLIAHVVPNGLADREGTLKIGDEILIVNGKRLRGLTMSEARKILSNNNGTGDIDIVISRYSCKDAGRQEKTKKLEEESSVDYENVNIENGHVHMNVRTSVNPSPKSLHSTHFRKNPNTRHQRDKKNESCRPSSSDKCFTSADIGTQNVSNFCTLPRRPRSTISTFLTVVFEKGPGRKSLGFTIVGGRDSPKGSIGIFIKSVLPTGQAAEDGRLRAGDEILAVNGQVCHDLTHREAVQLFRNIKTGPVALHLSRRMKNRETQVPKAKSCADLLLMDT